MAAGLHIGGFITVTVIGLFYAWKLGISFGDVRKSEVRANDALEEDHRPVSDAQAAARASD
jgi:hypothetical protein